MNHETLQSESTDSTRPSWAVHELVVLALTLILAVWVVAQWSVAVQPQANTERDEKRAATMIELGMADEKALNSFGVVDEKNALYRIPIVNAMTSVASIYETGETFTNAVSDRMLTPLQLGEKLFTTKICITCHQADPAVPAAAGDALRAPKFIGDFWGKEREVLDGVGGPVIKVILDEAYFKESVKNPAAKVVKGALSQMPPLVSPVTDKEIEALMIYVKSLSKQSEEK